MSKIKLNLSSEQNILNMLMEGSVISAEQMTKINNTSPEIGKTKLETAFELNMVDEDKILKILSANYSLPAVDLSKKVIDPKIKKIIDLRYIEENLLVPFEMRDGVIKIAIADASKLGLMKNLKTMTKMEPELYATSISEINNFIERLANQEIKKISARITPKSKEIAALNPLVMLVSMRTKKTGPKTKLKKKPMDIAVKRSVIITVYINS